MIEAGLEFRPSAKRQAVAALLSLPGELRPTHTSKGENSVGTPIYDVAKFLETVEERETSFFLKNHLVNYHLSIVGGKPIQCSCLLDVTPILAQSFIAHIATAQPAFGYACSPAEREHRNRVTNQIGVMSIESWVGRDIEKYIPGLYWLTLLPSSLAQEHRVPLAVLEEEALEHIELAGDQHLFRFYDNPNDWSSTARIKKLISSLQGVFDVEKAKPQLAIAKTFLEHTEAIKRWN